MKMKYDTLGKFMHTKQIVVEQDSNIYSHFLFFFSCGYFLKTINHIHLINI